MLKRFNQTINPRIWTYLSNRSIVRLVDVIYELIDVTTTRVTAPSAWRRLMFIIKLEPYVGAPLRTRYTHLIPQLSQRAIVRTKSYKINFSTVTWQTEPKSMLRIVRRCHLNKRLSKRSVYKLVYYNDKAVRYSWFLNKLQKIKFYK